MYHTYEILIINQKFGNLEGQYSPRFNCVRNKRQWNSHQTLYSGRKVGENIFKVFAMLLFKKPEIMRKLRKDTIVIHTQKRGFRENFVKVLKQKHNIN